MADLNVEGRRGWSLPIHDGLRVYGGGRHAAEMKSEHAGSDRES